MDNMAIANTILVQITTEPRKFKAMIGMKDAVAIERGLQFGFMKAKQGINKVVITLNDMDTYDLHFWNIRGSKAKEIVGVGDIQSSELLGVFENITGLDTHI